MELLLLFILQSELIKVKEVAFPNQCFTGMPLAFTVDDDGSLLGMFQSDYPFIARLDGEYSTIRPFGKGPTDLQSLMGADTAEDLLYVIEFGGSLKTFKRNGKKYDYVAVSRLMSGFRPGIEHGLVVIGDDVWIGGYIVENPMKWTKDTDVFPLQVFEKSGKPKKQLASFKFNPKRNHGDMAFYFGKTNNEIVCAREDNLKLRRFSTGNYNELPAIQLPVPESYLSIPDEFYPYGMKRDGKYDMEKLLSFRHGYSRISNLVASNEGVFVQFRNFRSKKGLYVVFWMEPRTYKMIGRFYTNDLLLACRDNQLYFHKGGDPSLEESECFTLVVCEVNR